MNIIRTNSQSCVNENTQGKNGESENASSGSVSSKATVDLSKVEQPASTQYAQAHVSVDDLSIASGRSMCLESIQPRISADDLLSSRSDIANIDDHLFLSGVNAAEDKSVLETLGVTHIVNLTGPKYNSSVEPRYPNKHPGEFNYHALCLPDEPDTDLKSHFHKVHAFISGAINKGNNVLVHCEAGISRSATMVIAFLMVHRARSLAEAYNQVKSAKDNIGPNNRFFEQLIDFENELFGKNSITIQDYLVSQIMTGIGKGLFEDELQIRGALEIHHNNPQLAIAFLLDNLGYRP